MLGQILYISYIIACLSVSGMLHAWAFAWPSTYLIPISLTFVSAMVSIRVIITHLKSCSASKMGTGVETGFVSVPQSVLSTAHQTEIDIAAARLRETNLIATCKMLMESRNRQKARADGLEARAVETNATITTLTADLDTARQRANDAEVARTAAVAHANAQEANANEASATAESLGKELDAFRQRAADAEASYATEKTRTVTANEEVSLLKEQLASALQRAANTESALAEERARVAETEAEAKSLGDELTTSRQRTAEYSDALAMETDRFTKAVEETRLLREQLALAHHHAREVADYYVATVSRANAQEARAAEAEAAVASLREQNAAILQRAINAETAYWSQVNCIGGLAGWIKKFAWALEYVRTQQLSRKRQAAAAAMLLEDARRAGVIGFAETHGSNFMPPQQPRYETRHIFELPDEYPAEVPQEVDADNFGIQTGRVFALCPPANFEDEEPQEDGDSGNVDAVAETDSHEGTFFQLDSSASTSSTSPGVEQRLSANADDAMTPPLGGGLQASEFTYNVEPRLSANADDAVAPLSGEGQHAGGSTRIFDLSFFGNTPSNAGQQQNTNGSRKTTAKGNRRSPRRKRK